MNAHIETRSDRPTGVRLRKVEIDSLFGLFDHHVPFFPQSKITIIHGPNGVGKTSVLRLIYGALKPRYSILRNTRFGRMVLTFADGSRLTVAQTRTETASKHRRTAPPHARISNSPSPTPGELRTNTHRIHQIPSNSRFRFRSSTMNFLGYGGSISMRGTTSKQARFSILRTYTICMGSVSLAGLKGNRRTG